ncbi:hypothetical protein [Cellulomonas citrea]|uniref:hypothetical protein n=1 Tax=Cellulomonas citrea TaxID=1909423 RepID=UPI00135C5325|nr:hypothetical protein [Cellulomonas citrea]
MSDEVPDDLSALDEPVTVALLLTQVAAAEPLAAVCSLSGVSAQAVTTGVGAVAVLTDPAGGPAAGGAVSRLLAGTTVVLLERRAGAIAATAWSGGSQDGDLAPGLVLSQAPTIVEDLLLGDVEAQAVDGAVSSEGISRLRALRLLTKVARRGRSQQ